MYDAIVVGARCAGSPTAMLLARRGYRVLLLDRSGFPSDAVSTHYIHQPGGARLKRWGLLDSITASGCPPIERQTLDVGPFSIAGTPPPVDGVTAAYAPRRTILDKILLDAAIESGVEVREHFSVEGLLSDHGRITGIRGRGIGGGTVEEKARIVIGADGIHSAIGRMVDSPAYNQQPAHSCAYYTYWSDVTVPSLEIYIRPERLFLAGPTNDGLTITISYWPEADFPRVRANVEGEYWRTLETAPDLARRFREGFRAEKFRGSAELGGFFRRPHGPGWALVGDAGYHKNPITAAGISDAFRDAEFLTEAIDDAFAGRLPAEVALAGYERKRNEAAMPLYQMTCDMAKLETPRPEMQALFAALRDNEAETGRMLGALGGAVPIPEFFSTENIQRITEGKTL